MPFRSSSAQRSVRTEHIAVMVAATSRNRRRETRESGSSGALKDMTGSYREFAGQVCAVTKTIVERLPFYRQSSKFCGLNCAPLRHRCATIHVDVQKPLTLRLLA